MRVTVIRAAAIGLLCAVAAFQAQDPPQPSWYRGNLHTHTTRSDGDTAPEEVARWYKDNGYQFLVLSDHNRFTDPQPLNDVVGEAGKFLLIPGEEVTDSFEKKPVHVNGYNIARLVVPTKGASMVATIQGNVNAIREAEGLPSVNHPNFGWAFGSRELLEVENLSLFEVYNGHPTVHNLGGGGSESLEEMWDALLTAGRRMYGIAVDDAHHFKRFGKQYSNPGRGWVTVRAATLTRQHIAAALAAGEFYSSTGVELTDVRRSATGLRLEIKPQGNARYRTQFIGDGGRLLATATELSPSYNFGGERYVRARVLCSNGDEAWVQPAFRAP
ncbi:MAG: PHP domain-containing protein [Bryobacteraceae bacterium]